MSRAEARDSMLRVLVDRCLSLEAGQAEFREELDELVQERSRTSELPLASDSCDVAVHFDWAVDPSLFWENPYRNMFESLGHAVYVCSPYSGEIMYWNCSAEKLYGWKASEVVGHVTDQLLVPDRYCMALREITESLRHVGQSWSGQFPLKKRSGEIFMAIVTKNPLYEDGELAGLITVSSDASVFNSSVNLQKQRETQECGRVQASNMKKVQGHSTRQQTASMPQIVSSVSNLASKLLPWKHDDDMSNVSKCFNNTDDTTMEAEELKLEKPIGLATKLLAELNIKGTRSREISDDVSDLQNGASFVSIGNKVISKGNLMGVRKASPAGSHSVNIDSKEEENKTNLCPTKGRVSDVCLRRDWSTMEGRCIVSPRECSQFFLTNGLRDPLDRCEVLELLELNSDTDVGDAVQKRPSGKPFSSSAGSSWREGTPGIRNGKLDSSSFEIRWEDLTIGEEVGQGSFAVVYHGIWNGSDVAIKMYFSNYSMGTLENCKKENDIIKNLRHPNVLLFMGAVYSKEKLAIVTEYLPRGSLFRLLHKNNQALDLRRRLRMALDVARGVNYLHRRNPPIVHRDLKSSNLLVDKNWNVKVGDFGLSKFLRAKFLSTKSGRGTPQWMAPEVLRSERSNEK